MLMATMGGVLKSECYVKIFVIIYACAYYTTPTRFNWVENLYFGVTNIAAVGICLNDVGDDPDNCITLKSLD